MFMLFFFFNDTATTEIYTLSLHDALPISARYSPLPASRRSNRPEDIERPRSDPGGDLALGPVARVSSAQLAGQDRKSTRLNSSHANISYAVFCLKKKRY